MENKDILSAAVAANEAELPVALDINKGVLDTATAEMTEEQSKDLSDLNAARTRAAIDTNALSEEQLKTLMMPRKVIQQVRNHPKVGRNEPCPCGSGKKYKHCCLSTGKYEGYHNAGESAA